MRILLVDDNINIAKGTSRLLQQAGCIVTIATDGDAALTTFEKDGPFDVVLTDILHPGLGVTGLIQSIWKINPKQQIGIITGFPILSKPFTKDQLLNFVDKLVKPPTFPSYVPLLADSEYHL